MIRTPTIRHSLMMKKPSHPEKNGLLISQPRTALPKTPKKIKEMSRPKAVLGMNLILKRGIQWLTFCKTNASSASDLFVLSGNA